MDLNKYLATPGEHLLTLKGGGGAVEAVLTVPTERTTHSIALLGHPHSLQGGTMNNKVVTTLARVFNELHCASLRFNFRGVGQSEGVYDHGLGESDDMTGFAKEFQANNPDLHFIFAGFSFGSYVAYRAAVHFPNALLILIAPPVHHYDYNEFQLQLSSWLIVHGDADEVVPYSVVESFAKEYETKLTFITAPNTSHFFHGKLIALKSELLNYLAPRIPAS